MIVTYRGRVVPVNTTKSTEPGLWQAFLTSIYICILRCKLYLQCTDVVKHLYNKKSALTRYVHALMLTFWLGN